MPFIVRAIDRGGLQKSAVSLHQCVDRLKRRVKVGCFNLCVSRIDNLFAGILCRSGIALDHSAAVIRCCTVQVVLWKDFLCAAFRPVAAVCRSGGTVRSPAAGKQT